MVAFVNQGCKGEGFGGTPVDTGSFGDCLLACSEDLLDLWVEVARLGKNCNLLANVGEDVDWHSCVLVGSIEVGIFDAFPLL